MTTRFTRWRWLGPLALAATATAHASPPHHHGGGAPSSPPTEAAVSTPPAADAAAAWRAANDAVGAFPRGHADIVRWERAQGLGRAPSDAPDSTPRWTLDDIARLALASRPDLIITPGLGAVDVLQRQQDAAAAVRAAQAAWLDAIAARQQRLLEQEALTAAQTGAELAQRMRQAGNFSAERQLREALVQWNAEARLQAAQEAEQQALVRLWQQTGGADTPEALARHLPEALPARPALPPANARDTWGAELRERHPQWRSLQAEARRLRAALPDGAWDRLQAALAEAVALGWPGAPRLAPTAPRWPHAWEKALEAHLALTQLERRLDGDLQLALAGAQRAAERAQRQQTQVLPALKTLEEETLLRYNGMLLSTWDLLAAARDRIAAQQAAIGAERDAWLAWLDLQAVRNGLPYTGRALSAPADAAPNPAKGH